MEYYTIWKKEEQNSFQGWNFSHLEGRMIEEPLPWDYKKIIQKVLKKDDILLDLGTGGGEFLLTLQHPYSKTYVTEGYEPNYRLCKDTLEPRGITVAKIKEDDCIPYNNNMFDVVINRHESFDVKEIERVLKPGGYFITQQVGEKNTIDLSTRLCKDTNYRTVFDNDFLRTVERFKNRDFTLIQYEEAFPNLIFTDIGALVYFAKIIEWEYPGFNVDTHYDVLLELQKELEEKGSIIGKEHRYIIVVRKKLKE